MNILNLSKPPFQIQFLSPEFAGDVVAIGGNLSCQTLIEMIDAYLLLHQKGLVKSVEVWQENELVGGLYGVDLGGVFCGESMLANI